MKRIKKLIRVIGIWFKYPNTIIIGYDNNEETNYHTISNLTLDKDTYIRFYMVVTKLLEDEGQNIIGQLVMIEKGELK